MTMTHAHTGELDPAEGARLVRLERTVDRAVEVAGKIAGEALATIRDEKLYRMTHTTFEEYVGERWGFSRRTAYRMIEAATAAADPRKVEGLCQGGTNPQPAPAPRTAPGRPDSPFVMPEPAEPPEPEPMAMTAGRLWATVSDAGGGEVRLVVDRDAEEYPPLGAKVLVAWER